MNTLRARIQAVLPGGDPDVQTIQEALAEASRLASNAQARPLGDGSEPVCWRVLPNPLGGPNWYVITADGLETIAICQSEEHARLCAVAPELLYLVRDAFDSLSVEGTVDILNWLKAAGAVIAKAE